MLPTEKPTLSRAHLSAVLLALCVAGGLPPQALAGALPPPPPLGNIPFTFSNGTPADAEEVNQNFANLDTRLGSLEASNVATVPANCALDPEAVQDAVDSAPAHGLIIDADGTCNSVNIFNKANIMINGPATFVATGTEESDRPLNIGLSRGIFINDITADALNTNERAVNVGASTALFTNLVAKKSTDIDVSVNTKSVAILSGTSLIGDVSDVSPGALEVTEISYFGAEGNLTLRGSNTALRVDSGSRFSQESGDSASNAVTIVSANTAVSQQQGSWMFVDNGSITGNMRSISSDFFAAPNGDQAFDITGRIELTLSKFSINTFGGTGGPGSTISGGDIVVQISSVFTMLGNGSNLTLNPTAAVGGPFTGYGLATAFKSNTFLDRVIVDDSANFFVLNLSHMFGLSTELTDADVDCGGFMEVAQDFSLNIFRDLCAVPAP
ncbi:MAG: hypothetical protein AAGI11_15815 [Pseudomonadota bacterium]